MKDLVFENKMFIAIDDGQIILDILNKYNDISFLVALPSEKLLLDLKEGKKVIEKLIEQNYNFKNLNINNLEIVKILYKYDRPDIMKNVNVDILLNKIDKKQPRTYFDYILGKYKKGKTKFIFDPPTNIKQKAKYYITLAKNDMLQYTRELRAIDLISKDEITKTTLLAELLKENRKITLNKILTTELKKWIICIYIAMPIILKEVIILMKY